MNLYHIIREENKLIIEINPSCPELINEIMNFIDTSLEENFTDDSEENNLFCEGECSGEEFWALNLIPHKEYNDDDFFNPVENNDFDEWEIGEW